MAVRDGKVAEARSGRRSPAVLLVFLVVAVLSAGVVVAAYAARPPLTAVKVAGSLGFLDDPEVRAALREHGLEVTQTKFGSRQIAENVDLSRYDLVVSGSAVQAKMVAEQVDRHLSSALWFSSPMVIVTDARIAGLLEQIGVAGRTDGTWRFEVEQYLDEVAAGRRWYDKKNLPGDDIEGIAGNTWFRNPNRMLVTTTNPEYSNSAAMFIAIASFVINDGVVSDPADIDRVLARLAPCFTAQGDMATRTPDVMNTFLTGGIDAVPMGLVYENDVLVARRDQHEATRDMVAMYPNPTLLSGNTLVSRTALGERLSALLTGDKRLRELAAHWGYRDTASSAYREQMRAAGIEVHRELEMVGPPQANILNRLIDGVKPR